MAISLKHNFQSAVADGGDTTLVQPSNWNAEHDLTLATARLIGRTSSGTGSAEEISVGTGLNLSSGSLAVSSTTPQVNSINTFTASQVIEVTDNSNPALRITQLGTGNAILVEDSANPDSTPFLVTNDGQVISGSTTSISGTAGTARFQSNNSLSGFSAHYAGVDASPAINTFLKSRGGAVVNSEDQIGSFRFEGFDGTNYVRAAQVSAFVDGTPGTNDMPGRLVFYTTADGAATPTERFRIGAAGQLGVGGANYGTSGQVLTSGGASAAPSWTTPSASAAGGMFWENDITLTSNYTITTNKNAMTAGPVTINSGVTVTVPSGSTWTIV